MKMVGSAVSIFRAGDHVSSRADCASSLLILHLGNPIHEFADWQLRLMPVSVNRLLLNQISEHLVLVDARAAVDGGELRIVRMLTGPW